MSVHQLGVNDGDGVWGAGDVASHFTIGRAQIVRADVNSHQMIVIVDGKTVMNVPASYGLGSDPNRNTTNGIHVVMSKPQTVLMSNPKYGYNNVPEHWAVRIENNGEFIHANPLTDGVQGSENVTHGCVNLSTDNAEQYFNTAIFGDPVEVTNSPVPLTLADGDIARRLDGAMEPVDHDVGAHQPQVTATRRPSATAIGETWATFPGTGSGHDRRGLRRGQAELFDVAWQVVHLRMLIARDLCL